MPQSKLHDTISTCHHQNITKNQFFSSTFGSTNFQTLSWFLQIKRVPKRSSNSLRKIAMIFKIMVLRQRVDAAILHFLRLSENTHKHILDLNFRALLCLLTSSRLPLSTLFPALSSAFPRRAGVKKRPCQNQKRSFHLFSKTIQVNIHNLDTLHDSTNKILQGSGSFFW